MNAQQFDEAFESFTTQVLMNKVKVLTICLLVHCYSAENPLTCASIDLINSFGKLMNLEIYFIKQPSAAVNDLIESILQSVDKQLSFQHETFDDGVKVLIMRKRSLSVIFASNSDVVVKFFDQLTPDKFHYDGYYLIIFTTTISFHGLENIFESLWMKFIFNVNVLMKAFDSDSVDMLTFLPFNGNAKCGNTNALKINEFDENSMAWKLPMNAFFPKKFNNLRERIQERIGAHRKFRF